MLKKIKKNKKLKIILPIIIVIIVLYFSNELFYRNLYYKFYKPLSEYETMNEMYVSADRGIHLYTSVNNDIYDGIMLDVHKVKNIDTNEMIIARCRLRWGGAQSYVCKATDTDIDPIRDWEIEKISLTHNEKTITVDGSEIIQSIRNDILGEFVDNYDDLPTQTELNNILVYLTITFKETKSIILSTSIDSSNCYSLYNETGRYEKKLASDNVVEYIYNNFLE